MKRLVMIALLWAVVACAIGCTSYPIEVKRGVEGNFKTAVQTAAVCVPLIKNSTMTADKQDEEANKLIANIARARSLDKVVNAETWKNENGVWTKTSFVDVRNKIE